MLFLILNFLLTTVNSIVKQPIRTKINATATYRFVNALIVPTILCRHTGHLRTDTAHSSQHTKWRHGRKSSLTGESRQMRHVRFDRSSSVAFFSSSMSVGSLSSSASDVTFGSDVTSDTRWSLSIERALVVCCIDVVCVWLSGCSLKSESDTSIGWDIDAALWRNAWSCAVMESFAAACCGFTSVDCWLNSSSRMIPELSRDSVITKHRNGQDCEYVFNINTSTFLYVKIYNRFIKEELCEIWCVWFYIWSITSPV